MMIRKTFTLILSCWLLSHLTLAQAQTLPPKPTEDSQLLVIYILAFDNQPLSTANLTPQYQPTIESILAATQGQPDKTAVILTDLDGVEDSHILVIHDGQVLPILGLPDKSGQLNAQLHEYDMSDGATLGGFIQWSRAAYPATKTIMTYIGHGAPLVPQTDLSNLLGVQAAEQVNPLPSHRSLGSSFTDYHPLSLISPRDLAVALQIGTNNGKNPLAVIDLVHCFSASIEEFYELSPYTEMLTGSPNYTYATPTMVGQALSNLQPEQSAVEMADTLIKTYHESLPNSDHPRLLVAVDSDALPAVKQAWDITAYYLRQQLVNNRLVTKNKILTAYRNSAKYDTTFCDPPDWDLAAPDALSDMADFAAQLTLQFKYGMGSEVGTWASVTQQRLQSAIVSKYVRTGSPWFALNGAKPNWQFKGAGLALYTDFQPVASHDKTVFLSQQAAWYTTTVTTSNPEPYRFIQGAANWAQVMATFWEGYTVQTAPCLLPVFPPAQDEGELTAAQVTFPPNDLTNLVSVAAPMTPSVAMTTAGVADDPLVEFKVWQNQQVVFSDTVSTGYLITGTHEVVASRAWQPQQSGLYTLEVRLDTDNRVLETNEEDNAVVVTGQVLPPQIRPHLQGEIAHGWQWLNNPTIPVTLAQDMMTLSQPTAKIKMVLLQVYQYPPHSSPNSQILRKVYEGKVSVASLDKLQKLDLPSWLEPGPVMVKLWGVSLVGAMSVEAVNLSFNYTPPQARLNWGQTHYFLFNGRSGDKIKLDLLVEAGQDANLFVWLPLKYNRPAWQAIKVGNDTLNLNPIPYTGQYLVAVQGVSQASYQLVVTKNDVVQGGKQLYLPLIRR